MLEYDNSAFYYFALTLLVIYILPGTYFALSELFYAVFGSGDVGTKARTKEEKEKAENLTKQTSGWKRLNTTTYIVNLVLLIFAWLVFIYLITLVINDGEVSSFDPYQILGIEQGTSVGDIKKAYRKLSLKFHPDKNIGNKVAEEMFMKIAKAYEALTDETSKENYEKYGNPDGKQALEVSIGLPKILLENPKVVLVLYLIAMVVVIPSAVGWWYSESKQYGEKNIMYDTYGAFYSLMQQTSTLKQLPEILAASAEFRKMNDSKANDEEPLKQLIEKLKNDKLMLKPKYENKRIIRGNLLLHAHLLRLTKDLNKEAKEDLMKMLNISPDLIEGMVEISYQRKWPETAVNCIKLAQCIVQGLWPTNMEQISILPFKQLPYLGDEDIKQIIKGTKPQAKTLADYLRVPDSEKKGIASLSAEDKQEFFKACALMPKLTLETKIFVEEDEPEDDEDGNATKKDDKKDKNQTSNVVTLSDVKDDSSNSRVEIKGDQIFEQDLVTLRVIITRENLPDKKNAAASAVYAPHFPSTVYENLWVVLLDKPRVEGLDSETKNRLTLNDANIHAFEKITEQSRVVKHDLHFMAPQTAGKYDLELRIFSDSYLGLDEVRQVSFEVLPASMIPEYTPHPDDLALDNEPTLFEQMMAANVDDDSSDDEDDDSEEEMKASKRSSSTAITKKNAGKRAAVVVEDAEDSD